jgi:proline iminopeptidase
MLGMCHALEFPERVLSLVNCGGPASAQEWIRGARELLSQLPADEVAVIHEHESRRDASDPRYLEVLQHVNRLHSFRLPEMPLELKRAEEMRGPAQEYMWGSSYFDVTGTLRSFDITNRLPELSPPCLIMCGRFDNSVPRMMKEIADRIPSSDFVVFERSSHLPMWEEKDQFMLVVRRYLSKHSNGR